MKQYLIRVRNLRWSYPYFYILLSLGIMGPLLLPGYIFALDMTFTPSLPLPSTISSYLFHALLHYLSDVIPSQLIQKLLLLSIFILGGIGMHRLIRSLGQRAEMSARLSAYFAGMFYILNPFVYERFVTGQYSVLLGYIALPWFVWYFKQFLTSPSVKKLLGVTILTLGISIVSIHTCLPLGLLALGLIAMTMWRKRHNAAVLKKLLSYLGVWIVGVLIGSSYWLIPLILGQGHTANLIDTFTLSDQQAFATTSGQLGLFGNVAAMQGFWAEAQNLFLLPSDQFTWWLWPIILIWILVGWGIYRSWLRSRAETLFYGVILSLGLVLAIGVSGTIFAPLNAFLLKTIPLFSGYREPQKFVMLIVLSFAYFSAQAIIHLAEVLKDNLKLLVLGVAFLLPLLITPLLPWGAAGQLHATDYPKDWYAVRSTLAKQNNPRILFLPWHLYMSFSYANRVIANPAPQFFPGTVYVTNNLEFDGATNGTPSSVVKTLNDYLTIAPQRHDFASVLHKLGIEYVIVDKDFDYSSYNYINQQQGIAPVQQTPSMTLYKVE